MEGGRGKGEDAGGVLELCEELIAEEVGALRRGTVGKEGELVQMHLLCRLEETAGAKVLLPDRVLRTKGDVRQSYHICQVLHHQHPPPPPHPPHSLTNRSTRQWTSYGINTYGVEWRKRMSKGSIATVSFPARLTVYK